MPKPEREEFAHESYGTLVFSRSSQSRRVPLFGSSIKHGHTVSLVLSRAVEHRELSTSRVHATERLFEVEMSEAQFARLITNMNTGSGVPVTIVYDGEKLCEAPPVYGERQRVREELAGRVEEIVGDFDADVAEIERLFGDKGNVGKTARGEILARLRSMQQRLRSNVPFIHECFDEAVEGTVTEAMAEIEAHATSAALKLGAEALRGGGRPELAGGTDAGGGRG